MAQSLIQGGTAGFAGVPITGFAQHDTIDLAGIAATGDTYGSGVLTLTNVGSVVATVTVAATAASPTFSLHPDGAGGTSITLAQAGPMIISTPVSTGVTLSNTATDNPTTVTSTGCI